LIKIRKLKEIVMRDPTRQRVLGSIDEGIRKAQKDYKEAAWTPLCHGPEYLITVSIFYSLLNLTEKDSLTLEDKPKELLKYLKEKPQRGRPRSVPPGMRLNGRADICLWHIGENRPRAIIEVKRCAEDWINNKKDIDRVAGLLCGKEYRKFEFGILASCIHRVVKNNNGNELERKIHDKLGHVLQVIEEKLDDYGQLGVKLERSSIKPLNLKCENAGDSENWIWQPVVFKIYHKRNRR